MSGRFTLLVLAGLAAGLIILGTVPGLLPESESRVVDATTIPAPNPEAMTADERAQNADCVPNADWPDGEVPAAALVRHGDASPLVRVTFDEAWTLAESGEAWFVASCRD